MIVADTNLLAYLLLPTVHTEAAEHVLIKDPDWLARELGTSLVTADRQVLDGFPNVAVSPST